MYVEMANIPEFMNESKVSHFSVSYNSVDFHVMQVQQDKCMGTRHLNLGNPSVHFPWVCGEVLHYYISVRCSVHYVMKKRSEYKIKK